MTDDVKDTQKDNINTKKMVARNSKLTASLQLAKNREKTKKCRERQNISSISSRLVYKIPEPGFSVNKYSTPIILSFD